MAKNSTNINKTITSHLNWTRWTQKRPWQYDVGNPGPGLGQAHKCDGVKPVNEIPTLLPRFVF